MLVRSYNHLHLIGDVASSSTKQDADKDYGLNIFQMTNNNVETAKEIVARELLDFRRFHVDVKDIKTFSNGGSNMSLDSMQLAFLQNKS
jgi:hypothetical protein